MGWSVNCLIIFSVLDHFYVKNHSPEKARCCKYCDTNGNDQVDKVLDSRVELAFVCSCVCTCVSVLVCLNSL